jgi:hypothetical protein
MAIPRVAAGNEHPIGTGNQGLGDKKRINPPGAWKTDDAQIRWLRKTAHPCCISSAVRTPIAQKSDNAQFLTISAGILF